jgi:hypothetical protein
MRLILLLFVSLTAWCADTTLYVNTASTAGTQDCTTNTAGNSGTAACATLSQAESIIPSDITTGGSQGVWTIICEGSAADTTPVVFSGVTTSATYYIVVTASSGATYGRHQGVWNTGKYRLSVADSTAIDIRASFIRIDGLQISKTSATANAKNGIEILNSLAVGSDIRLSNLIIRHSSDNYRQTGIRIDSANANVFIWNIIDYGHPGVDNGYDSSIEIESGTASIYSSTLIGGYNAINRYGGTVTVKNTYGSESSSSTVYFGTMTLTNCASSDDSGTSGLTNIALNTTNFTNVTAGSEDFRLPVGSALIGVGTDTSGESAPLNFTTDITGATRTTTWDVGADEYVSATTRRRLVVIQ